MADECILFRGAKVMKGWPDLITQAQMDTTYMIDGVEYKRIPYGKERHDWHAEKMACHDCAAIEGELHVPGCDVEECPRCHGQFLSCGCGNEECESNE